jgi:hypothetical protein
MATRPFRTKSTAAKAGARKPAAQPKQIDEPTRVQIPGADTGVDVLDLLWRGIQKGIDEHRVEDLAKVGLMRGASSGLYLSNGQVVGPCPRAALARMMGGEPPAEEDRLATQLMFDSGHANETSWVANLERTWPGEILREEEFPIEWRITDANGVEHRGSGREDLILCAPAGMPGGLPARAADGHDVRVMQFVELKQISSISTAMDVLFADGKPKLEHAIQVGRYTRDFRVPTTIAYSLPFVLAIPNWSFITPKVPARGEPHSQCVDYGKDGKASKIRPTAVAYRLMWHGDVLHYCRVGDEGKGWVPTIVTAAGLDDFWHCTLDQSVARQLYPQRPTTLDLLGEKRFFSMCSYCQWKSNCDANESNYDAWEAEVRSTIPTDSANPNINSKGK